MRPVKAFGRRKIGGDKPDASLAALPAESASGALKSDARCRAILRGQKSALADPERAGGALTLSEACQLLGGVSGHAVGRMVKEGRMFTVPCPGRRRIYPILQFTAAGKVEPWMTDLLVVILTKNPWVVLNFLVNQDHQLDGRIPLDMLMAGQVGLVLTAVKNLALLGA